MAPVESNGYVPKVSFQRSVASAVVSYFDLDLQQLTVKSVDVNGHKAAFTRNGQECLALIPSTAGAQSFTPGDPGIGDPYFPLEGNGGYDVQHYDLTFSYDPATDRLDAVNKITARATQGLSRRRCTPPQPG
jgi:hypothetical protein